MIVKPTYNSIKTKDDKEFLAHAKKHLGFEYEAVLAEAEEEYQKQERASIAKREANLVILRSLIEIGKEHWRNKREDNNKSGMGTSKENISTDQKEVPKLQQLPEKFSRRTRQSYEATASLTESGTRKSGASGGKSIVDGIL